MYQVVSRSAGFARCASCGSGRVGLLQSRLTSHSTLAGIPRSRTMIGSMTRGIVVCGIETTCDDTGVGVVKLNPDNKSSDIVADVLASQFHLHAAYAGIVPHFAARAHQAHLPKVWDTAIEKVKHADITNIDALGLAVGPGLAPCLSAGLQFTKRSVFGASKANEGDPKFDWTESIKLTTTAKELGVRFFIPVNHLEAHLLMQRLFYPELQFPFLTLLVSGGHTMLVLAEKHSESSGIFYQRLAGTMDDSLGECFDKVARMLRVWKYVDAPDDAVSTVEEDESRTQISHLADITQLKQASDGLKFRTFSKPHTTDAADGDDEDAVPPGTGHLGALLECLAMQGNNTPDVRFPVPMRAAPSATCTFSFSGLKSAVRRHVERRREAGLSKQDVCDIAAAFHTAALSHIGDQLARALSYCTLSSNVHARPPIRQVVLCGGVAANQILRAAVADVAAHFNAELVVPPPKLCTDNGVMIAWAAAEKLRIALGAAAAQGVKDCDLEEYFLREGSHWGVLPCRHKQFPELLSAVDIQPRWRF